MKLTVLDVNKTLLLEDWDQFSDTVGKEFNQYTDGWKKIIANPSEELGKAYEGAKIVGSNVADGYTNGPSVAGQDVPGYGTGVSLGQAADSTQDVLGRAAKSIYAGGAAENFVQDNSGSGLANAPEGGLMDKAHGTYTDAKDFLVNKFSTPTSVEAPTQLANADIPVANPVAPAPATKIAGLDPSTMASGLGGAAIGAGTAAAGGALLNRKTR